MKDESKELEQDNVGKEILPFIPNNLGINLKGCIDALIKYSEEQKKKELEEFGNFLKEVIRNEIVN